MSLLRINAEELKARAEELIKNAKENCSVMKMSILDYTDGMLFNLQEKTDELKAIYFNYFCIIFFFGIQLFCTFFIKK